MVNCVTYQSEHIYVHHTGKAEWLNIRTFDSMDCGKNYVRGGGLEDPIAVNSEKQSLRFNYDRACPGNGKTRVQFICVSHTGCGYRVRLVQIPGNCFQLQEKQPMEHALIAGIKKVRMQPKRKSRVVNKRTTC